MKAKKSFGQHFLHREDIAERIAHSIVGHDSFKQLLEIGPGKGMLTKYLMELDYELWMIEADWDMADYLRDHYPLLNSQLIVEDFLKFNIHEQFGEEPFAIIGNFPYNISSQILIRMIENRQQVPVLVGMFQKEVAERVASAPGKKAYGVISVLVQAYFDCEYLFTVDKSAFSPPPKVQSGVIRITRKENTEINCSDKLFRSVVKQAFSQRRKMLRNTMKSFLKDSPRLTEDFFTKRPEQLSVDDFVLLTNWVEEARANREL